MSIARVAPTVEVTGKNLPLGRVTVSGKIFPTLATLKLTQQFTNGDKLADVTYHCPLHLDWAVRSVTMKYGEREVHTIVLPNRQAMKAFQRARRGGHTAILADEVAADELRLQLANVPAGAVVEVATEVIAWPAIEGGRGAIVIPLLNGPKYGGAEAQQAYFDPDDPSGRQTSCYLDLELNVANAAIDVGTISGATISGEIDPVGQVTVSFDAEPHALYHEDERGKYLVVGVPALRPAQSQDWGSTALLIDRSGSMGGLGIDVARLMASEIADRIGEQLKYVYAFDDECAPIWPVRSRGARTRRALSAAEAISRLSARGGTELGRALDRTCVDLKGEIANLVLITDALVDQSCCPELLRSIESLRTAGIAVHVVLVGTAPGRFVGECLSNASGGFYLEQTGASYDAAQLTDAVTRFLAGGTTLRSLEIDGANVSCAQPLRGRPVMVAVAATKRPSSVTASFDDVPDVQVKVSDCPEARFIWARERVMQLIREAWRRGATIERQQEEIERLGVEHQILTPFTSMVGIDASASHDRSKVEEIIVQGSLPVGIDPEAFYGIASGGVLGLMSDSVIPSRPPASPGSTAMAWLAMPAVHDVDMLADLRTQRARQEAYLDAGADADRAATLLAEMLERIESHAGPVRPRDVVGPWVRRFSLAAIVIAASALEAVGCHELAELLAREAAHAQGGGIQVTRDRQEIDRLARAIARLMGRF